MDEVTQYIDPGTIRVNGHMRRVWELHDLKQRDLVGGLSARGLTEYDCKEERSRYLSFSTHSEAMIGGTILRSYDEPSRWDYIPPGTIAEDVLKIVCAVNPDPAAPVQQRPSAPIPQRPQPLSPSDPLFRPL